MARHGCRRGGACSGEMRRHRLCFQDSSQWIAARSTARLAEGTGVGEGLEAGASWWQLTVARCAKEWQHGARGGLEAQRCAEERWHSARVVIRAGWGTMKVEAGKSRWPSVLA
jgi:hypothetical protein